MFGRHAGDEANSIRSDPALRLGQVHDEHERPGLAARPKKSEPNSRSTQTVSPPVNAVPLLMHIVRSTRAYDQEALSLRLQDGGPGRICGMVEDDVGGRVGAVKGYCRGNLLLAGYVTKGSAKPASPQPRRFQGDLRGRIDSPIRRKGRTRGSLTRVTRRACIAKRLRHNTQTCERRYPGRWPARPPEI